MPSASDEIAGGRPTWDERNGTAAVAQPAPGPLMKAGIDVEDPPPPPDRKATERYRRAILKLAEAGGQGIPTEDVLAAAGRTLHEARIDLDTATKRFAALAAIDQGKRDLVKAEALAATPPPRGAQLDSLTHVADLLEAIAGYHREMAAFQATPPGQSLRAELDRRTRQGNLLLVETADPAIDREIDAIRFSMETFHRRVVHWGALLAEAQELTQLRANVDRWGVGQLHDKERIKLPRDRLLEGVIPSARQRKDEAQTRADQQRLAELLTNARKRIKILEGREAFHRRAEEETTAAQRELDLAADRIRELTESKRRPETMRWAP